jgi:hypothetical protein
MAYQFSDGFDNYGNAYTLTAGYPWSTLSATPNTVITSDFRFAPPSPLPGGCMSCIASNQNFVRANLSGSQPTLIAGFGFKSLTLPGVNNDIFALWDSGTIQCTLNLNSAGVLQFTRGIGTTIGTASPSGTIVANTWYGIQVQVTINGSTGAVACYLNGSVTPVITASGLNTQSTGNASANQVSIGSSGGGGTQPAFHFDDFFCFDTTGTTQNALLGGDCRILTKMPASAGNYTNWTPNGLANNFSNAAVQPPSVADYNSNNTGGTKDSYTMQNAGLAVAPYFVVARASLERDDAGTHTPSLFVRSSSVDSPGVVTPTLTSSYVFYDAVFATDPATGLAWTGPGADDAQVGVIEG